MMTPSSPPNNLARQVRERFVRALDGGIADLEVKIQLALAEMTQGDVKLPSAEQLRLIMDTDRQFLLLRKDWTAAALKAWHDCLRPQSSGSKPRAADKLLLGFELEDEAVMERKILASRLASAVVEAAGDEINTLKLRVQSLEQISDLPSQDALRPETLGSALVKAWFDVGLTQPMWHLALPAIQAALTGRMAEAYEAINKYLIDNGVMPEIDLRALVKRDRQGGGPSTMPPSQQTNSPPTEPPAPPQDPRAGWAQQQPGAGGHWPQPEAGGGWPQQPGAGAGWQQPGAGAGWPQQPGGRAGGRGGPGMMPPASRMGNYDYTRHGPMSQMPRPSELARAEQETRMVTSMTPMARIRQRAQGVLGQLRRMLTDRIGGYEIGAVPVQPSPRLASALAEQGMAYATTELMEGRSRSDALAAEVTPARVQDVAADLRKRAADLKAKAEKPSEKAIIEIVALMFQAILAEERIAPSIRVWFARLQIPVLRLALAEPDFFASVQHPARQLIDRMGACALGFDAAAVNANGLEREIKRIVQVIEQYPETGRRVFQLVLDEFKKFLGRSLTEGGAVHQAATLAQQVEQKEALSIQYTIELRRMLDPVPVGDDVRQFLFRVWSDVLAMAAVRYGPQHAETLLFKKAAADLLWAASPRQDRAERAHVAQKLAGVIAVLRKGMTLLAIAPQEQDGHVKLLNDAVMQAFASHGESISQETLDELSRGLAALEDVVTDDPQGDVLLDPDMIEMMFGVGGESLEVISTGGSQPTEGMLQWARELEQGTWFSLELRGVITQVQYVWRSAHGQLHLLASSAGKSYLVQTRRLASYLQAGLLVPVEDEALTVRATRQALARLNATPDQLLH